MYTRIDYVFNLKKRNGSLFKPFFLCIRTSIIHLFVNQFEIFFKYLITLLNGIFKSSKVCSLMIDIDMKPMTDIDR